MIGGRMVQVMQAALQLWIHNSFESGRHGGAEMRRNFVRHAGFRQRSLIICGFLSKSKTPG
jgi:hypothetical protein